MQLASLVLLVVLPAAAAATGGRDRPEHLGLPAIHPCDGARAALGERLFRDPRLSGDGRKSCASCHDPGRAFTDGRRVARGIGGKPGSRNTLPLVNAALHTTFLWEGSGSSLERTTSGAFFNSSELGLGDRAELLARIGTDESYVREFRKQYPRRGAGEAVSLPHVEDALGCYVRSLAAGDSAFDRYMYQGDRAALTEAQKQGLRLFQGKLGCAACHTIGPRHASFTDDLFHPGHVAAPVMHRLPLLVRTVVATPEELLGEVVTSQPDVAALGRFVVTRDPGDVGRFRTPSLRNVAITAPYLHDGSVETLAGIVEREVYYRGAGAERPMILTPSQRDEVVAFLESLTSARYAPPRQKPLATEKHASLDMRGTP